MDSNDPRPVRIFKLLGSAFRLRIIEELRKRPLYVSELTKILNVNQSTISHKLAELEEAGIIQCTSELYRGFVPEKRRYSLVPDTLATLLAEATQEVAPEAIKKIRQRKTKERKTA